MSLAEITEKLEMSLEQYLDENLKKIISQRDKILEIKKKKIEFCKPILEFNGFPCIFQNSITIIQGKSGSHKSRFCETLIVELIKQKSNILLVDTERNSSDHLPQVIQNIQNALSIPLERDLDNFDCISLMAIDRDKRADSLRQYLEHTKFEGVVFIDVVSDMLSDFNSISDTYGFFDYVNQIFEAKKISFVLVIHENPSPADNKARGHLGTESKNKASIVISVNYSDEKIHIKYLKSRHSKLPIEYYLEFDEITNLLKPADAIIDNKYEIVKQILIESMPKIEKRLLFDKISSITSMNDARTITKFLNKSFYKGFEYENKLYQVEFIKNRPVIVEFKEINSS